MGSPLPSFDDQVDVEELELKNAVT